jgi:hypothetical protein
VAGGAGRGTRRSATQGCRAPNAAERQGLLVASYGAIQVLDLEGLKQFRA